jgi:hypothetical protein
MLPGRLAIFDARVPNVQDVFIAYGRSRPVSLKEAEE